MPLTLTRGEIFKSIDDDGSAAPFNGKSIGIPKHATSDRSITIGWRLSYGSAPSAVNVILQISMDDIDANFATIDVSTAIGGEHRTVAPILANFIRIRVVSKTGGGNVTGELMI